MLFLWYLCLFLICSWYIRSWNLWSRHLQYMYSKERYHAQRTISWIMYSTSCNYNFAHNTCAHCVHDVSAYFVSFSDDPAHDCSPSKCLSRVLEVMSLTCCIYTGCLSLQLPSWEALSNADPCVAPGYMSCHVMYWSILFEFEWTLNKDKGLRTVWYRSNILTYQTKPKWYT